MNLRKIRDGQNARDQWNVDAERMTGLLEAKKISVVVKKLRNDKFAPEANLAIEVFKVSLRAHRLTMRFGVTGHRNAELRELVADQGHQFARILKAPFHRFK